MRIIGLLLIVLLVSPNFIATAQDSPECEDGFRLIEHVYGEICIPTDPQRVIALDTTIMELMLVLGMEPVVTSSFVIDTYITMHPELEEFYNTHTASLPDLGFPPNLEVILEAEPDLIIAPNDLIARNIYNQLSDTFPIVVYEVKLGAWKERLRLGADLLNQTEAVEALIADYETRVAELQAALGEDKIDTELSLVRTLPGQVGIVISGIMAQSVVAEVGLSRPSEQDIDVEYVIDEMGSWPEIRLQDEELALADGDIIFVFGRPDELFANPLWQALPAVKDGRSYEVGYYWWGESLLCAHDMLDDLFEYVAEVEPENPNPFEDGFPVQDTDTDETPIAETE